MYKVMVIDDHPIVRKGLSGIIDSNENLEVIASASDGIEALAILEKLQDDVPDIILVDVLMPRMNGIEFIKTVKTVSKIIILSTEIDRYAVVNLLSLGISGYLLKDEAPNDIVKNIEKVLNSDDYVALSTEIIDEINKNKSKNQLNLSDRQIEVLGMVANGLTNKQIGKELFTTERTVKAHLTEIYTLLNVSNRAQAIAVAIKKNII
ncbi:response regulator [Liquorilactobacillus hordei]|uniref:Two-component response regulator n=3 Tax=Liquorilactobacillus hordei TaxID=468911 RepID=A0A0R1MH23_9LACO|nr:response regulator transcription factor [Liquorilactobacillus hordei]AUJ30404.1 two-component system response regulator [Liquorilactobacillus hordei]KRL05220.1 two-component response regulator [Liquorilactobacillus hordei DSM 19519]QYH53001.1 response regulator transcription factor [Liquorilactobacillus hordei DSM 19519]